MLACDHTILAETRQCDGLRDRENLYLRHELPVVLLRHVEKQDREVHDTS